MSIIYHYSKAFSFTNALKTKCTHVLGDFTEFQGFECTFYDNIHSCFSSYEHPPEHCKMYHLPMKHLFLDD